MHCAGAVGTTRRHQTPGRAWRSLRSTCSERLLLVLTAQLLELSKFSYIVQFNIPKIVVSKSPRPYCLLLLYLNHQRGRQVHKAQQL